MPVQLSYLDINLKNILHTSCPVLPSIPEEGAKEDDIHQEENTGSNITKHPPQDDSGSRVQPPGRDEEKKYSAVPTTREGPGKEKGSVLAQMMADRTRNKEK